MSTKEGEGPDAAGLPLHVKDVPRIKLDAMNGLAASEKALAEWRDARRWLDDVSKYAAVPRRSANGTPAANLSADDVATLRKFGVVKEVRRCDVQGWTKMFAVPEFAKARRRPIRHTFVVNDALGKETAPPCSFPSKSDVCSLVNSGTHFIALDFAAYYDQFEYSEDVGKLFCFRSGKKFCRLTTLAMGQRQAVGVAAAATHLLLDFEKRSRALELIDNVIFAGSREDVLHDAACYIQRVEAVGAKLNEDVEDLEGLVRVSGEWCGVALNLEDKTVALTAKTIDKVVYSWQRRSEWTWRNFAAHIGLLFWSWGILELPMAEFFPLLRFVSHVGAQLHENDQCWDEPAVVWPSVWPVLERWTLLARANAPRVVVKEQLPEWLVCTDASLWGWGYVALNTATFEVRTFGAPWSADMRAAHGGKLGRSTFTEPHGVINSLCHLLPGSTPVRVRVGTDSTVARASYARGFNTHSYDINECLARLQRHFGRGFVFEWLHVPGELNPADPFSRGGVSAGADSRAIAGSLRRLLGSGAATV
jgi:hypothetical protein